MATRKQASLLPDSENTNSLLSRSIRWLTTVGRVIIIFTELIVISAFISRFWLDRRHSDISEALRQQQAILKTTAQFEVEFKSLQSRLNHIAQNYQNQPNFSDLASSLVNSAPPSIYFKNVTISHSPKVKAIKASASLLAIDEPSIINFINNLILNPDIDAVTVSSIQKKTKENNYRVEIDLVFKAIAIK